MSDHEDVETHEGEKAGSATTPRFKRIVPRAFLRWLIPVWLFCLITGSLLPGNLKVRLGTTTREQQIHPNRNVIPAHRITHLASFGFTACLFLLLARTHPAELQGTCFVVALGCAIEFAQHAIYGFRFEWWDVRDDTIGAAAAYFAFRILQAAEPVAARSRLASPSYKK